MLLSDLSRFCTHFGTEINSLDADYIYGKNETASSVSSVSKKYSDNVILVVE